MPASGPVCVSTTWRLCRQHPPRVATSQLAQHQPFQEQQFGIVGIMLSPVLASLECFLRLPELSATLADQSVELSDN